MPLFHFCEDSDKRAKLHKDTQIFLHMADAIEPNEDKDDSPANSNGMVFL